MTPESIYERFLKEFPDMRNQVVKFNTCRGDGTKPGSAIRILLRNHRVLRFDLYNDGTWILKRG